MYKTSFTITIVDSSVFTYFNSRGRSTVTSLSVQARDTLIKHGYSKIGIVYKDPYTRRMTVTHSRLSESTVITLLVSSINDIVVKDQETHECEE